MRKVRFGVAIPWISENNTQGTVFARVLGTTLLQLASVVFFIRDPEKAEI